MIKQLKFFWILLFCLTISACGFQMRSAADFPSSLRPLYFSSVRPYSLLSVNLRELFNAMHAPLTKTANDARFSIFISQDHFIYSRPDTVDATLPTSIGFSQIATINIQDNQTKKTLLTKKFTTSDSLTLNANQIYTANSNDLMRQELNHEMISLIYYWLISKNTTDVLNHHAANTKTTRRAS